LGFSPDSADAGQAARKEADKWRDEFTTLQRLLCAAVEAAGGTLTVFDADLIRGDARRISAHRDPTRDCYVIRLLK
jgi:hypothetical protein